MIRHTADTITDDALDELYAEIARLADALATAKDRVEELETWAHGCDGEGCVLPHSSWCELAKKAAAENDGCTCGRPQSHAGHCWRIFPPRNEIEEMRRTLAARGGRPPHRTTRARKGTAR